jgi:hypothetical protein
MNCLLRLTAVTVALVVPPLATAQSTAGPAGHWEGAIQVPNSALGILIDLAKNEKGEWEGTIDIPAQNLKAFPLTKIAVKENSVRFVMKGPPGDPSFDGKLSADGTSMTGIFSQGGASLDFAMKRTGDARMEAPAKSTPVTKELEGAWEGTLNAGGKNLRLILKMTNQSDGAATGSIVSVDQNGVEIPVTTITQNGASLKLDVKSINASYTGELKDGTLTGDWTQGQGTLPLTFKRPEKQEKK